MLNIQLHGLWWFQVFTKKNTKILFYRNGILSEGVLLGKYLKSP